MEQLDRKTLKIEKNKGLAVFTAIFFVLFLALAVRLFLPYKTYELSGSYAFEPGVSTENAVVYSGITLPPGVYRVALHYDTDTDAGAYCNVHDGTVFSGGLLSNAEHFYSALGSTDYAIWLFEGTKELEVTVTYEGKGHLTTGDLTITETKQLWTMLLAILVGVWAMGCAVMLFRSYDQIGTISRETKDVVFWLTVIILVASIPYLNGYVYTGADLTYHLHRIEGVKDGLLSGQFPVRLEPRWVFDHGYANAIFYCNTLLYFPAFLRMLGFTVSASYNLYCIALNIATACIAYYCFGKMLKSSNLGILCSALYTLSIFRIYKLVVTTAVGEGSAYTFLPLILYGLYRVFTEDDKVRGYRTAWIPLALGFAGLMQTHVLTCEITAFVTLAYCLFHVRKVFRPHTFWELAKGAGVSVLLSLWFLVPFLDYYLTQDVHIKFVSARRIQNSGLLPAHLLFHFWTTGAHTASDGEGLYYSHPVGVGLVLVVGLFFFGILWFQGKFREKQADSSLAFMKKTALIGALLLAMSMSVFPWDKIQSLHPIAASLVSSLQFPNRFLGWGTTCLVPVLGYGLMLMEEKAATGKAVAMKGSATAAVTTKEVAAKGAFLAAVLGIATSGMFLTDFISADQDYFELYNREGMGFGYISGKEYLIEGTKEELLTFAKPETDGDVQIAQYTKYALGAEFACANEGATEGGVKLPLLLYKGYQAVDTDSGLPMELRAGDNGEVCVRIPVGYSGNIRVSFVSPIYWRISEGITFATVLFLIGYGVKYRRKKK